MNAAKVALRRQVRARLRGFTGAERVEAGAAMVEALGRLEIWRKAGTVLVFQPRVDEPDITPLWSGGFDPAKRWVFPRVEGDHLVLYRVEDASGWSPGPFGILEPTIDGEGRVDPAEVELALVPGLAFDRGGGRLGRGKGFYDRLLGEPGWRGVALGVAWVETRQEALPLEPHDRRMDGVLWSDGTVAPEP
ncbi:MAG: 5-formyltetrahydrofolate cyclo-ligase [Verrucomicrobiia bacterium]